MLFGDDGEQWVAGHGERDHERIGARLALAGVDELGVGAHDVLHRALDGIVDVDEHRGALLAPGVQIVVLLLEFVEDFDRRLQQPAGNELVEPLPYPRKRPRRIGAHPAMDEGAGVDRVERWLLVVGQLKRSRC